MSGKCFENDQIPMLDLKLTQCQQAVDQGTPKTRSTAGSSANSFCNSDAEDLCFDNIAEFVPSVSSKKISKCQSIKHSKACHMEESSPLKRQNTKEGAWKKKVKTELCRFWLRGLQCENQMKEQGCGFAHGQEELQKKNHLSRQYLTSVCKNFLEHPSKCTYGARCIFQHPTKDVRVRQSYNDMILDNQRYTAMRLFQEIEGADVFYINTYAATTPRLGAFKAICNNAKDQYEETLSEADWAAIRDIKVSCKKSESKTAAE